jgi:hypothetical protein
LAGARFSFTGENISENALRMQEICVAILDLSR